MSKNFGVVWRLDLHSSQAALELCKCAWASFFWNATDRLCIFGDLPVAVWKTNNTAPNPPSLLGLLLICLSCRTDMSQGKGALWAWSCSSASLDLMWLQTMYNYSWPLSMEQAGYKCSSRQYSTVAQLDCLPLLQAPHVAADLHCWQGPVSSSTTPELAAETLPSLLAPVRTAGKTCPSSKCSTGGHLHPARSA